MNNITGKQISLAIDQTSQSEFNDFCILDELVLHLSHRNFNLKFSNCQFLSSVNIFSESASVSFDFQYCVFDGFFEFQSRSGRPGSFIAANSHFKKGLTVDFNNDRLAVKLESTQVAELLDIKGNEIYIMSIMKLNYGIAPYYLKTNLQMIQLIGKVQIVNSFLGNADFSKTVFKESVSFDNSSFASFIGHECVFENDIYCNNTNFGNQLFVNGSRFLRSALFINCNDSSKDCNANFSGTVFEGKSFFNKSSFNNIVIKNSDFKDMASFKEMVVENIEIERSLFHKGADFSLTKFNNADRETYRTVRSELQKVDNKFEVLFYHAKELEIYRNELTWQRHFGEKAMLTLNKYSNNYGLYWWRGVYFTVFVGIVFYIFYLISLPILPFQWGWVSWNSFLSASNENIKYFIKFFTITHDFEFMESSNPTSLNYAIDFIGRIFLGFGIYQTIAAFRKYGKI